jgi:hypothetical protein
MLEALNKKLLVKTKHTEKTLTLAIVCEVAIAL